VRVALRAAALRAAADRRRAADLAWRASALCDAADRGSRFNARFTARDRRGDGRVRFWLARVADLALCFVRSLALGGGDGSFTPARRAFESPIAIACFADAAPCLPSRT
jgi:hypothetical protein